MRVDHGRVSAFMTDDSGEPLHRRSNHLSVSIDPESGWTYTVRIGRIHLYVDRKSMVELRSRIDEAISKVEAGEF